MADRIRFHLNEHVSEAVADALKRRRIDVTTTADAGLLGASDEAQLEFAMQERRVLVTHDAGFLRLHAGGRSHAGIAYCDQGSRTVGQLTTSLVLVFELLRSEEMAGHVEYL